MSPASLISGHLDYRATTDEKEYLRDLARNGQKPHTMFIGCCDSRVIPEQFTGAKPGEIFVLRNIANHVPSYLDKVISVSSAITYAVQYLNVQHIVVCGHTECGGVQAAQDPTRLEDPLLRVWVQNLHADVEENALASTANLRTYPIIQSMLAQNQIQLHTWVYDIETLTLKVWADEWTPVEDLLAPSITIRCGG